MKKRRIKRSEAQKLFENKKSFALVQCNTSGLNSIYASPVVVNGADEAQQQRGFEEIVKEYTLLHCNNDYVGRCPAYFVEVSKKGAKRNG